MINIVLFKNKMGDIYGFDLSGHAGFADSGEDIVCSAVSVLVINTINSIEEFLDEKFLVKADEVSGGFITASFPRIQAGGKNPELSLLLKVMEKGLLDIESQYGDFIKVVIKEVPIC